jgi:hypothetical protein
MEIKLIKEDSTDLLAIVVSWEELANFVRQAITVEAKNNNGNLWHTLPIINIALFEAMRHDIPKLDTILKQISGYLMRRLDNENKDRLLCHLESQAKYWRNRLNKEAGNYIYEESKGDAE